MDMNSIGAHGAEGLANALQCNDTLTSLSLAKNTVTNEALPAVVDMLMVRSLSVLRCAATIIPCMLDFLFFLFVCFVSFVRG